MLCGMLAPRPKGQLPSWRHCNASGTEKQKPAFCPDVGKERVSSQVVILSTTAPAARSARRCGNSTPWRQKVNFSDAIHTPRNSSSQPKPDVIFPFLEAMVKGHKLPAYLHRPVPDEF